MKKIIGNGQLDKELTEKKQYLEQAFFLDLKIESKKKELKSLKEMAGCANCPNFDNIRVQSSKTGSKIEAAVEKIIDEENKLRKQICKYIEMRHKIEEAINKVKEPKLRMVLSLRHLDYMKFPQIAAAMHYSHDHVKGYLYNKALLEIKVNTVSRKNM